MIGYIIYGTNNLEAASHFYDELFKVLGYVRCWSTEEFNTWGEEGTMGLFACSKPYNKEPATAGNGTMLALAAKNREEVDAVYAKAIELGATCEGQPGLRGEASGFYAAYFRDLDGNKLNAFIMPSQP